MELALPIGPRGVSTPSPQPDNSPSGDIVIARANMRLGCGTTRHPNGGSLKFIVEALGFPGTGIVHPKRPGAKFVAAHKVAVALPKAIEISFPMPQ